MEIYTFKPKGVCSREFKIYHENGLIKKFDVVGGCPGNLTAIGLLIEGQPLSDIAQKLKGVRCGTRSTSCADQLAIALGEILTQ